MPRPDKKMRIDLLLVERGLAESQQQAQALLMAGEVTVDGRLVDKAGALVNAGAVVEMETPPPYVGRGGIKLAHALQSFALNVNGAIALDVGSSTGGFTDCLLQHGAARVYAVDVGYGQLHMRLRQEMQLQ